MPVNKNETENSNETSFPNIKIIILGVLLATSIIGGLCYYFATNKNPSEKPVQEVIEDNQETENNNQTNNKENIEKQEEIIINNEYIPVIDCLWLNIPFFVIVSVVISFLDSGLIGSFKKSEGFKDYFYDFVFFLLIQASFYFLWFILMLIFAAFSKIWDKEHSWWSNVKKGFLRNRIYFKGDYFWTFWLLAIVVNIVIGVLLLFFVSEENNPNEQPKEENNE